MKTKSKISTGVILILIGVLSIISQMKFIDEYLILPIIAAGFLTAYVVRGGRKYYKNIGLLIPACILPVVQIQSYLTEHDIMINLQETIFLILLGVSFMLIYFIHSFWYTEIRFGKRYWSLITSIMLFVSGIVTYLTSNMGWKYGRIILNNIWPVALIIVGAFLIIKNNKEKSI